MHIKNKRGQSTVEYILLVTAVIAVIILFEANQNPGSFQAQLNSTLNNATADVGQIGTTLVDSHAPTTASTLGTPPAGMFVNVSF